MTKVKQRSKCPLSCTLDIIGDKWSLLVLRDVLVYGKKNYGDFIQSPEKIASNILADRLKLLCEYGILEKHPDPSNKLKINYIATEKGMALQPVMMAMKNWGNTYFPDGKPHLVAQA